MVFSSTIFLFFFLPLTLIGYYLIDRRFKNVFLLIASLAFYAWGEPLFVLIMIGFALINHFTVLLMDNFLVKSDIACENAGHYKKLAKLVLTITVVLDLSLFFIFKYLNFTISNINYIYIYIYELFSPAQAQEILPQTNIALPIGISFFVFQILSYVFDIYYRKGTVQKNPLNTMLYISLFPQLIAGPIVRYQTVADELRSRKETLSDFIYGTKRFIIGLGKKAILSNTLAITADYCFNSADYTQLTALLAWVGILSYTLQIYFDFSGYSDMAIGLGRMFGFHFDENFNYPYISASVSEFWRRWHISLGTWFRDYVYFPMGGSRVKSKSRLIMNLFVVWLLTGVWHGASWNFIVWGLFYFVILVFEKLTGFPKKFRHKWQQILYRIFTLLCVILGWVVFRAPDLSSGMAYIGAMFGLNGTFCNSSALYMFFENLGLLAAGMILSTPIIPLIKNRCTGKVSGAIYSTAETVIIAAIFIASISFITITSYDAFIYFNF